MKRLHSDSDTLSVAEAAKRLGVSATLLYRQCSEGKFPCIRIGVRVLISKAVLEEVLNSGTGLKITTGGGRYVDPS